MLKVLHSIEFVVILNKDENRLKNVTWMQIEFAEENGLDHLEDDQHISVFEILATIAIRAEEQIMQNPEYGDRTPIWFWDMMRNLGLDAYNDYVFDTEDKNQIIFEIESIIRRWMDRDYDYDGRNGGMVHLKNPREDLRKVDIWYQLMWWLVETEPEECAM